MVGKFVRCGLHICVKLIVIYGGFCGPAWCPSKRCGLSKPMEARDIFAGLFKVVFACDSFLVDLWPDHNVASVGCVIVFATVNRGDQIATAAGL